MSAPLQAVGTLRTSRIGRRKFWRDVVVVVMLAAVGIAGYLWWDERPVRQIDEALRRQSFQQAIVLANDFLRDHPEHLLALEMKARALAGLKRWKDASDLFEQTGVMTSAGERAWSLALLHQQRWSEAQPLLTHLHQQESLNAEVLHELIACNGKLGNLEEALRQAARLAGLPGQEARGNLMLGTLHNNQLNRKQAIQAWKRVLAKNPDADQIQISADEFFKAFGRAYLMEGQPREAIPLLEKSLAVRVSVDAKSHLGDACEQTNDLPRAIALWTQVVEAQPKSVKAREGLARTALSKKQPDKALEWLNPLVDQPDLESSTAYLMQRTYALLGDKMLSMQWEQTVSRLRQAEQRRDLIETGIQRSPQSLWSQAVLAHRFAQEGNVSQAARILLPLMKEAPDEPFLKALAQFLEKSGPLPSLDLIPVKQF